MIQNIFKRQEIKYLVSNEKYNELMAALMQHMEVDEYGLSHISSIYFDTANYDLIRESLEKPVYKEKLRLRAYGEITDDSKVFLELKKKYNGTVYKRRISLTLAGAMDYLINGNKPDNNSQIFKEIDYFVTTYKPDRGTLIAYDRIAMYGKENKSLRITFDRNIKVAFERLDIKNQSECENVLEEGFTLMEIKAEDSLPIWLTSKLSELEIYPSSFSKYGKACMDFLNE